MPKLGEALSERARLQRKVGELRSRINANAATQEGDEPPENPVVLLDEVRVIHGELAELIARINLTNAATMVEGESLTRLLARRDEYAGLIATYSEAARYGQDGSEQRRYMRSELKLIRNLDVAGCRRIADRESRNLRELDNQIQEVNWTTDLI